MPVFDPLTNIGTSQVFYQILNGRKNPKAIADALGTQPPPVIQQLRRLQKIKVIKLGRKEGKFQNYEIRWNNFLTLFIDRSMQEREWRKKELIREGDIPIEYDYDLEDQDKIKTLKNNRYFKRLIQLYLQNMSESKQSSRSTISQIIDNFENTLQQSGAFKRSRKIEDPEKQDFFNKMRLWHERASRPTTWMDLNLHDAISKTLKE